MAQSWRYRPIMAAHGVTWVITLPPMVTTERFPQVIATPWEVGTVGQVI